MIHTTRQAFIICLMLSAVTTVSAQSFWFGPKGALSFNLQKWNGFDRDPLINFNGDIFIESEDDFSRSSLYAQLGYHTRGSATRVNFFGGGAASHGFEFNNLVLELGAKQKLVSTANTGPYYLLGLRAEYTLGTNLSEYSRFGSLFYPVDDFVRKFNYGVTVGGGWEFEFSELIGGLIELTVNPDISKQYDQEQAIPNVINPFNNQPTTLQPRSVRNLSFEVKFGLRFMRKVEYID